MNKKIILLNQRVTSFVNRWHGFDINYRQDQNVERYSDICLHARITLLPKHSRIISQREWLRFSLSLTSCPLPLPRPHPPKPNPEPVQQFNEKHSMETTAGLLSSLLLLSLLLLSQNCCRRALLPSKGEGAELIQFSYTPFKHLLRKIRTNFRCPLWILRQLHIQYSRCACSSIVPSDGNIFNKNKQIKKTTLHVIFLPSCKPFQRV